MSRQQQQQPNQRQQEHYEVQQRNLSPQHRQQQPVSSYLEIPQSPDIGNSNRMKVVAGYGIQQKLGSGSFAVVYKGVRIDTNTSTNVKVPSSQQEGIGSDVHNALHGEFAAIKAIARNSDRLTPKVLHNLEKEISILRSYMHRNIVCLFEVQKTSNHFYLILEYCAGGDLQRLIRERKTGRLSESLSRRLMRDLCGGLAFLNKYQLIHRDIKPQNLLLTGCLPLDEVNDPCRSDELEFQRKQSNFPTSQFVLKIADFGFARHLQTTSLAETLCGSPLYMAPEILSHQRYDEKADLWSVGTVLFEMISGKPPFTGDNHIHLLQNIQKNAVRLPPGVRVSKECVNLLRILLNRNPNSRATFREFITVCDAFVALGCNGVATIDEGHAVSQPNNRNSTTMEAITDSMMTVEEATADTRIPNLDPEQYVSKTPANIVSPLLGPVRNYAQPVAPMTVSASIVPNVGMQAGKSTLSSLVPSPPCPGRNVYTIENEQYTNIRPNLAGAVPSQLQQKRFVEPENASTHSLQNSTDDFVMVEHQTASMLKMTVAADNHDDRWSNNERSLNSAGALYKYNNLVPETKSIYQLQQSPPTTPGFTIPRTALPQGIAKQPGDYMISNQQHKSRGMLSTSPGTGGVLMGMMTARSGGAGAQNTLALTDSAREPHTMVKQAEMKIKSATKMLAASEDVGRRAVSVAHLGDTRAVHGIRLFMALDSSSSSFLSSSPMEGIDEETSGAAMDRYGVTTANRIDDTVSTDVVNRNSRYRIRGSSFSDNQMSEIRNNSIDTDDEDEMPFALQSESPPLMSAGMPTRSQSINKGTVMSSSRHHTPVKLTPTMVRSHFSEALLCYVKALNMLKGAFAAVEGVVVEVDNLLKIGEWTLTPDQIGLLQNVKERCDVSKKWLGAQFNGVLERGDAANVEIRKFPQGSSEANNTAIVSTKISDSRFSSQQTSHVPVVPSVEELIYNQSLALGREGAVKQLLGQNEQARSCYRSAGLLAETLLMDAKNIVGDDRKILEGYVDAFSTQISELDTLILQQQQQSQSQASRHSIVGGNLVGSGRQSLNPASNNRLRNDTNEAGTPLFSKPLAPLSLEPVSSTRGTSTQGYE